MKHCAALLFVVAVLTAAVCPSARADTFRVPVPYATIQDGIDAASEGDTVLVAPGTYTGVGNRDIGLTGANILLASESGAASTIIDCQDVTDGIAVYSGEDSTCVVRGFTIENGQGGSGGGIYVSGAAPIIEDCVIRYCSASNGGGIWYGYSPTQGVVRNCVMYGNSVRFRGGGILCTHGYSPDYVPVIVRDCVVYDNDESNENAYGGGGIFCSYSSATIVGCTVVGNTGEPGRGAIHGSSCTPVVRRTVSAFNLSGPGVYNVDADHCVIYGNVGDVPPDGDRENLELDPLFCDLTNWDLTVCANSPCLAGEPENPWGEQVGARGAGCPECDTAVEETTWGAIKALYISP